MKLACKELVTHLDQRLELDKQMIPMRIHRLFDEFNSFLRQRKKIDVFDCNPSAPCGPNSLIV
jgi:hypothetical protein